MSEPLAVPPSEIRRIVFLGTPDPSVVALRALADAGFEIPLVVSRPDRRRGRGSKLIPSPVKQAAMELGLTVTDDLADVTALLDDDPSAVDAGVVVAYGRIIPVALLQRLAMVNIHFSLLPRWRGAAPVERAILAGDAETGVCLMEVAEGLDEGGVYAKATTSIGENESAAALRDRLAVLGAELLVQHLTKGLAEPEPQVGETTYAAKIDRGESRLDFTRSAVELHRTVRVGRAWAEFRGKRLGIESTLLAPPSTDREEQGPSAASPATVAASTVGTLTVGDEITVDTGDGRLQLVSVKPEGKRAMSADDWANGVQPKPGESLG
jgi:methionyl-tRNA formyltransferase